MPDESPDVGSFVKESLASVLVYLGVKYDGWSAATVARAHNTLVNDRWELRSVADAVFPTVGRHPALDRDPRLRAKADWIPDRPLRLSDVDQALKWEAQSDPRHDVAPQARERLRLFRGSVDADGVRREDPTGDLRLSFSSVLQAPLKETRASLYNGASYRLLDVDSSRATPVLTFTGASYFDFLDTCEVNAFLLALLRERPVRRVRKILPRWSRQLPLAGEEDQLLKLGNRYALVGINCLLLARGPEDGAQWQMYLHARSGRVVESRNTMHVVPAGTFQPDLKSVAAKDQLSIARTVMREFLEETQGADELADPSLTEHDFLSQRTGRRLKQLIDSQQVGLWYLGLTVDPISTKPEMLVVMTLDGTNPTVAPYLASLEKARTYEGRVEQRSFSEAGVSDVLHDRRLLPAAFGCIRLAAAHRELIVPSVAW